MREGIYTRIQLQPEVIVDGQCPYVLSVRVPYDGLLTSRFSALQRSCYSSSEPAPALCF